MKADGGKGIKGLMGASGVVDEGVVEKVVRKERCVTVVGGGIWLADAELPVDSRNENDCS
jgi:hypothetical protein